MRPEGQLPDGTALELLSKQLDRHQIVIGRLADNQVKVKTWCVTALGALAALGVSDGQRGPLVIGIIVVASFFFLDAYYLSLERHFRAESDRLIEAVVGETAAPSWAELLRMGAPRRERGQAWRAVSSSGGSLAVSPFYLGLIVMLALGFLLTH